MLVVDNGPAEQPSCPIVQNDVLLHLIGLHKITQESFAEYHSERNFVESACREQCCQNMGHFVARKFMIMQVLAHRSIDKICRQSLNKFKAAFALEALLESSFTATEE